VRVALVALCFVGACAIEDVPARRSTLRVVSSRSANASGGCGELSWPVVAILSSPFGTRDGKPHLGIDLAVPEDTDVRAACDGVVTYADDKLRGYGRMILVEHAGGLSTVYAHNHVLLVAPGDHVVRDQVIARSGATGHVTAPHVHFEVRESGRAVDPLPLLAPRSSHFAVR
jgi:murein DD-endopeptidase MepM/ murein hydrolase activator NlpD